MKWNVGLNFKVILIRHLKCFSNISFFKFHDKTFLFHLWLSNDVNNMMFIFSRSPNFVLMKPFPLFLNPFIFGRYKVHLAITMGDLNFFFYCFSFLSYRQADFDFKIFWKGNDNYRGNPIVRNNRFLLINSKSLTSFQIGKCRSNEFC
jgi:hypothetical protein